PPRSRPTLRSLFTSVRPRASFPLSTCSVPSFLRLLFFIFFHDTATPEIYTLSLHDALPIHLVGRVVVAEPDPDRAARIEQPEPVDRKSTRLNSSHEWISYAVFCLKKKKNNS